VLTLCAGRLLLGRRPGAPRRTLAFPPAAAVPPAPAWRGAPPRVPPARCQLSTGVCATVLIMAFAFLALAVFYFYIGCLYAATANLMCLYAVLRILV
jgi:hypothetical protein